MSDPRPDLRASDAERERTAAQLRAHCAAGRLTPEELDERADAALAARTVGELRALLADLPPLPAAAQGPSPARAAARRRVLQRAGWWAIMLVAAVVLWVAAGADGAFWPIWVALAGAARVAFLAWAELGPGAEERARLGRGSAAPPREREQR